MTLKALALTTTQHELAGLRETLKEWTAPAKPRS
jgi:hypothetical protein